MMNNDLSDTLKNSHPKESGHWYDDKGNPAYTQITKAGHERPTTLRDARKLHLLPSVTTVINAAAKPQLEIWKQNQILLAALTLPKQDDEADDLWCRRIIEDSKQHAMQAAARGTEIHAAIQSSYEGIPQPEYSAYITAVENELSGFAPIPGIEWAVEQSFAHPLGYGGKCDISAGSPDFGQFVVDFKTKEFTEGEKLKTWDEQAMQLAAYRTGLGLPDARCAIIFVSVSNPGIAQLIEIPEDEIVRGWAMFKHLLGYWQNQKKYYSQWEELT